MAATIQIHISDPPTPGIINRFRNFGEDIYHSLHTTCSVSLAEIDASTTSFAIRDIHPRHLGEVTQTIKHQLKKHHFDQSATLTRQ